MSKKRKFSKGGVTDYGLDDIWWFYKQTLFRPLSEQKYKKIIKLFFSKVVDEIIEGHYVSFPNKLGDFFVSSYTPQIKEIDGKHQHSGHKVTDWGSTKKLWKEQPELTKKIYLVYENSHTGGKKYKLTRINCNKSKISRIYNFEPSRNFSRKLAKYIKNNPNVEYYEY